MYPKFPSNCFPVPCKKIIDGLPDIVGSRAEFGGLAMLFAGSIIAAETKVEIKEGWHIDTNIYCAIVADKGEKKSPAIKFMIGPLIRRFGNETREYLKEFAVWDKKYQSARAVRGKNRADQINSAEEERPKMPWWGLITDGTVEGIRKVAQDNFEAGHPLRVGRYNDELDGWIQSMNQYKGEGGDMAFYLQAHDGDVHIKANKGEKASCPPVTLSLIGSIQPEIFSQSFNGNNTHNGLLDRIMVASPMGPNPMADLFEEWGDGVLDSYSVYINKLLDERKPMVLKFPEELKDKARSFNEWILKIDSAAECGASPKWRQHYFKVVGILAVLWGKEKIDAEICDYANELCRFFVSCWVRAYKDMNKSDCSKIEEKIIKILKTEKELSSTEIRKKFASRQRQDVELAIESMELNDVVKSISKIAGNGKRTHIISLKMKEFTA